MATGIAAVLATLSVGDSVQANVNEMLAAAAGNAALVASPGVDGRAVFEFAGPLASITDDPGVAHAYPVLRQRTEPVRGERVEGGGLVQLVDSGFQLSGLDMGTPEHLPFVLGAGRLPQAGAMEVAITGEFALQRGYSLGDTVTFATQFGNVDTTLVGLLDDAIGYASTNFGRVGVMALEDLQATLRLAGRASMIEIVLRPGANLLATQERLQATLGDAYTVSTPEGVGDVSAGLMNALASGLTILAATLLSLSGFLAFNTFNATVLERTREYALLRTICMTVTQIRRLALTEALLTSLLGVIAGILMGIGLSYLLTYLNALAIDVQMRTMVIPLGNVAAAAVLGVVVSLLAALVPAMAASRTPAMAALRAADEDRSAPGATAAGALCIALATATALWPWAPNVALLAATGTMALLFLGLTLAAPAVLAPVVRLLRPGLHAVFGLAGRLGTGMAARNATRNGVAIGMVVVGMALTVGVGSMVAGVNATVDRWIATTVVGDLFVTSPVTFPDDFAERAYAAIPDVDVVSGVGFGAIRFEPPGERARTIALVLVEPERFHPRDGFGQFLFHRGQGSPDEAYDVLVRGEALITSVIMERFGLARGDSVSLRTIDGFREFQVGGVIVDFTSGGEAVVMSSELMPAFGGGNPDLYVVNLLSGADASRARDALLAAAPELHLDVTVNSEYRDYILAQARQIFSTTNLLVALAIFISALGVANTLGMNLAARRHEIAVLRAIGLRRGGVARMVAAEGVAVTTAGAAAGLLAGLLLSRVIASGASALSGFQLESAFPPLLLLLSLLAAPVVGFLASLAPARRAARLPPVRALAAGE